MIHAITTYQNACSSSDVIVVSTTDRSRRVIQDSNDLHAGLSELLASITQAAICGTLPRAFSHAWIPWEQLHSCILMPSSANPAAGHHAILCIADDNLGVEVTAANPHTAPLLHGRTICMLTQCRLMWNHSGACQISMRPDGLGPESPRIPDNGTMWPAVACMEAAQRNGSCEEDGEAHEDARNRNPRTEPLTCTEERRKR